MDDDPVKNLVEELGTRLSQKEHSDIVLNNGTGRQFEIRPSEFVEITSINKPRRIAFVDGGDGTLRESPNFLITINRVYFSMFQGDKRVRPKSKSRVQFFSCITSDILEEGGRKKIRYDTRIFTHNDEDRHYMPSEADLASKTDSVVLLQDGVGSIGRKFSEWKMALHVVEHELESGDMIVMDGSLQTSHKNEVKYATRLYDAAMKKGVIVCGLAKTSRLITESGDPLLARIAEIAEDVPFGRWYVRVAEEVSSDDRGFMLATKLHKKSAHVFRFEILREQFERMDSVTLNSILASLAANSHDMAMIGYPYGAIDADRFAQVRTDELSMYRGIISSEMLRKPEWRKMQRYNAGSGTHDILNEVTS